MSLYSTEKHSPLDALAGRLRFPRYSFLLALPAADVVNWSVQVQNIAISHLFWTLFHWMWPYRCRHGIHDNDFSYSRYEQSFQCVNCRNVTKITHKVAFHCDPDAKILYLWCLRWFLDYCSPKRRTINCRRVGGKRQVYTRICLQKSCQYRSEISSYVVYAQRSPFLNRHSIGICAQTYKRQWSWKKMQIWKYCKVCTSTL